MPRSQIRHHHRWKRLVLSLAFIAPLTSVACEQSRNPPQQNRNAGKQNRPPARRNQNPAKRSQIRTGNSAARIVIASVKLPQPSGNLGSFVNRYGLLHRDYESIAAFIENVHVAVPVRRFPKPARYGAFSANVQLSGTTSGFAKVNGRRVVRGRFLSKHDEKTRNNVVVLGNEAAAQLFLDIEPVGKSIRIRNDSYLVVGRLASVPVEHVPSGRRKRMRKIDHNLDVYIPLSTMRVRYAPGGLNINRTAGSFDAEQVELHEVHVSVKDAPRLTETANAIRQLLERTHENEDYSVRIKR